jgi:hypothetical protein
MESLFLLSAVEHNLFLDGDEAVLYIEFDFGAQRCRIKNKDMTKS